MNTNEQQPLILRGFAPLAVAVVLGVLMVLLVPSIAPERVVIHPGDPITAPASTDAPTTTTPADAPTTTAVVAP